MLHTATDAICYITLHFRTLLAAEQEIQNGSWDEKLTQGYELVTPSDEPTQALYKHRYSAGTLEDAQKEAAGEAYASRADSQAELTIPSQLNQSEPPLPKEEAASPAKELHFADEAMTPSETSMHNDATSTTHPEREGAVASILQDVPEEDEEAEIEAEGEGEAGKAQKREEEEEIDRVQEKKIEQEGEASAALTGSRQTRRSAQPISTKGSAASASKGSAPERRSSSRVSRSSIANLSEIIPSTSSDAAEMTITSPPPTALLEDEAASPTRERDTVAPSSESMDVDLTSMVMEREDSKDSTVGQAIINTGTNTTAKRGRPPRKSSVPPVAAKDANKRKRTTTPQAQNKATSPAPSDRSRSKRVKTEEPESGLGTPGGSGIITWIRAKKLPLISY